MVYIKRLTIQGFKSFGARRSSLNLVKGFIVITGPNGGGKSNVIDAIKFSLGELSAQSLRVARLSELINDSGTGGKNSHARVSITLDNSDRGIPVDEDEVKITRKMTSTGESTYQLNNRVVSRVDLLTLLSSANVKASGFNIITQGAVLGIAEMSPDELRKMLEEVAGTAEYDKRKSEALEEMSRAERNIAVAKAGTSEVKQRVRQLEKEKTQLLRKQITEKEVLRLRAESLRNELLSIESELRLKEEEEGALIEERRACEDRVSSLLEMRGAVSDELLRWEAALQAKEEELREKSIQAESLQREMERVRAGIRTTGMRYVKTRHQLIDLTSSIHNLEERRAALIGSIRELLPKREELQRGLDEASSQLSGLKKRRDELAARLREIGAREREGMRRREEARMGILRREREAENRLGRAQWLADSLRRTEERMLRLDEEMSSLTASISRMSEEMGNLDARRAALRGELAALERHGEALAMRKNSLSEALGELGGVIREAEALLREEGEGALSTSRSIASGLGGGVVGVLADLAEAPRGVEAVFRSVLRDYLGAIVVKEAQLARAITRVAAENGLALTVISVEKTRMHRRGDCLACRAQAGSPEASAALHALIGHVSVVEDLDGSARRPIITRDGVYFDGECVYKSLGEVSINQRLIDELEELRRLSKKLSEKLGEVNEEELAVNEKAQQLRSELGLIEAERKELEMRRRIAAERAEQLLSERREAEEALASIRERLKDTEGEVSSLRREIEDLYAGLSDEEPGLSRLREELTRSIEAIEDELEERGRIYAAIQSEYSSVTERIRSLQEELGRVEAELRGASERAARLEKEADREKLLLREEVGRFCELRERYLGLSGELEVLRGDVSGIRKECEGLRGRLSSIAAEIEELRQRLSGLNSSLQSIQIVLVEKRMRLEAVRERLSAMHVDQAHELELLSPEGRSSLLQELEGELAGMELVNQLAPMQYSQIIENYRFRASRIAELENERREILRIIEKIDQEKIEVFTSVLRRVSEGFGFFFHKLTGGEAWLELSEPDKPLETGVEMILRFVGKPPRSSRGVSGGEKSVAAVSLLMSLQGLTPADFYIFDEVDAHMDVAYTKNLAELFKEMSSKTQIIAVSLKDIMAEHADQLIGVYSQMGESRIVLTRLGEAIEKGAG